MIEAIIWSTGVLAGILLSLVLKWGSRMVDKSEKEMLRDWRSDLIDWERNLKSREMTANGLMSEIHSRQDGLVKNQKTWRNLLSKLIDDLNQSTTNDELYGRVSKTINALNKQIENEETN